MLLALAAVLFTVAVGAAVGQSGGAPAGLTGLATDGAAQLAWQPVGGADAYVVLRGTTPGAISQEVTPGGGVTGTSFTDGTAANGTTYYYAVRAVDGGTPSTNSNVASVTPRGITCSGPNGVITENCFPGAGDAWKVTTAAQVSAGGIEGFASKTSVDAGESVDLKVNAAAGAPYEIQVYRTGFYGGSGARLVSVLTGLSGQAQPACYQEPTTTGITDCSGWATSAVLTTTDAWPSGVYLLRLVRGDNGRAFHILLTVRDDDSDADVLYPIPDTTYQAYNNYGGKSTYDSKSTGPNTIAGTKRAVKVSFDRPYEQARAGSWHDWYPGNDFRTVRWLEGEGYDVTYATVSDLERDPGMAARYEVVISGGHDEYYSSAMRNSLEAARDGGTSLLFSGANGVYWQVRFEDGPVSGGQDRAMVVYKTIQSGPPDPGGPTSTWRDPAGANDPENALLGVMYIGDNDFGYVPLRVSAEEGQDPVWRHTTLASLTPGTFQNVGSTLVGWEWDARVDNGAEPAGVTTVATSPVTGNLVQGNGASYQPGSALVHAAKYVAGSGAMVFATGTNHWNRALGRDAKGQGEPNNIIRQATVNVLSDMGARPESPSSAIVLDPVGGPPQVTLKTPAAGATGVAVGVSPTATFSRDMNASTINGSSVTLTQQGGPAVPATVTYSASARRVTIDPTASLALQTTYTAQISTAVTAQDGTPLAAPVSWSFTTEGAPLPPTVTATTPADGATGVNPAAAVTATFSRDMSASTITAQSFALAAGGQAVTGTVAYNAATRVATFTPSAALAGGTAHTATLSTAITAADGTALAAPVEIDFTTGTPPAPPTVTASTPADGATEVTIDSVITSTFSRDMSAASITAGSFTLAGPGGAVAATVSYNASTRVATLTPGAPLAVSSAYTATLSTAITAADGTALASPVAIDFTTSASACPCQIMPDTLTPVAPSNNTRDGRPNPGPWTRELGVKITATQAAEIRSVRFWKSTSETGTHTARVWTSGGTQIAQHTFTGESASGWQTQQLASPVALTAGQTYVISVNANTRYPITSGGLAAQLSAGPVSTVVGGNGVYSAAAGIFPTSSFNNSNYFVDLRVVPTGDPPPPPPTVTATTPADGATAVATGVSPTATFSRDMEAATITSSSVTLRPQGGSAVAAAVTYDVGQRRATINPTADLAYAQTYVAELSTAVQAANGPALASPVTWSFTTEEAPAQPPPTVTASTPADGAGGVAVTSAVTATFSRDMSAATISSSSFTLAGPGGAVAATVSYNSSTRVATLTPSAPLAVSSAYTATLSTAITAADGTALASPVAIDFTTSASACPCQLMPDTLTPVAPSNDTRDGRPNPGPWTRELGVKITATQAAEIRSVRFWKSTSETGTHTARVWTSGGTQIAQHTFTGESASGWQTQQLASPVALTAGQTYVISINANTRYPLTQQGLASQLTAGPVSTVVGGNGVYSAAAGIFPTSSFNNSNYFVDAVVVAG